VQAWQLDQLFDGCWFHSGLFSGLAGCGRDWRSVADFGNTGNG
jgi:hypothetical protein